MVYARESDTSCCGSGVVFLIGKWLNSLRPLLSQVLLVAAPEESFSNHDARYADR